MNIVVIGSGNIATHLGRAFVQAGHRIVQVYSRNRANACALASLLIAEPTDDFSQIKTDADLYLLAVSDRAIIPLSRELPLVQGLVVHCSGATPLHVLDRFANYGVIYPPQSFSKNVTIQLSEIPFGIEGNSSFTYGVLHQLMLAISSSSFACDTQQRLALHIAAVFANNFTNALYQISYDILTANGLPFHLLFPILIETVQKAQNNVPKDVQTGPAIRGDKKTIKTHLDFISEKPDWVKIYQQLSEEITIQHK